MIPWTNESVWLDAWPQNKSGSLWSIFHGSVTLPYILKAIWCINMIPWNNESVWLDAQPHNKSGSLWPIFHGSVILPYILKAIWGINMIPWNNESVWLDAWPQNKTVSLWPVFHGQKPLARAQLFKTNDDIVNDSLKFQMLISQICQYFLWKKCDKLLHSVQKLLSYFQRKMSVYWL